MRSTAGACRVSLAAVLLAAATASVLLAQNAVRVTPVLADDTVFATFAAPAVFSADVREAIQSGLPVTMTFSAELRRASTLWFDKTMAKAEVASTVRFDTLAGTWQVSKLRGGTVHWSQQTQKEGEMRQWATEFERVPLESASVLTERGDYYIRVRARDGLPRGFSLWPFGRDAISGRAEVTAGR